MLYYFNLCIGVCIIICYWSRPVVAQWHKGVTEMRQVMDSISTRRYEIFNIFIFSLISRQSAAWSSTIQYKMPPDFGAKWGTECLNTRFTLFILQCAKYSVTLKHTYIWVAFISYTSTTKKKSQIFWYLSLLIKFSVKSSYIGVSVEYKLHYFCILILYVAWAPLRDVKQILGVVSVFFLACD